MSPGGAGHVDVLASTTTGIGHVAVADNVNVLLTLPGRSSCGGGYGVSTARRTNDTVRVAMSGERVLVVDDSPTILKVVQMVLSKAGYEVRTAGDGDEGVRAARAERPDLILVDFVMPRMNGYQMCRAMAEDESLRDVPVVLMSAKGDQVGERFVKVMGIVDYITKPFSPDAITAVVDHTIAKYGRGGEEAATDGVGRAAASPSGDPPASQEASPAVEEAAPEAAEVPEPPEGFDRDSTARRAPAAPDPVRKQTLEALREVVVSLVAGDLVGDDGAERVRARLTDQLLEQALKEMGGPKPDPQVVLEGDLLAVPVAQVLALLADQRQTGVLAIRRGEAKVEVHFRNGKIDFASGVGLGDELLLGRFLVARESISRQDLDLFIQSRGSSVRLIGEQLVKLNYVSEEDLKQALARQTCERIYEALRWSGGRFTFRNTIDLGALADRSGVEQPPLGGLPETAALALTVDGVLMEGLRRVDEWHLIEREVDDFDAVFLRDEELVKEVGRAGLTREEHAVLELINGKHTVKDIVRLSRMSSFEVSKVLFRLKATRLVRRRVPPVAV